MSEHFQLAVVMTSDSYTNLESVHLQLIQDFYIISWLSRKLFKLYFWRLRVFTWHESYVSCMVESSLSLTGDPGFTVFMFLTTQLPLACSDVFTAMRVLPVNQSQEIMNKTIWFWLIVFFFMVFVFHFLLLSLSTHTNTVCIFHRNSGDSHLQDTDCLFPQKQGQFLPNTCNIIIFLYVYYRYLYK